MRIVGLIILGLVIATVGYVKTDSAMMIVGKAFILLFLSIFVVVLLLRMTRSEQT